MATDKKSLVNLERLKKFKSMIDSVYVKKEMGKGLSTLDYNQEVATKIDGKADKTELASANEKVKALEKTITENKDNWAKNTEYTAATTSKEGLMTAADKSKLDTLKAINKLSDLDNDKNYQTAVEVKQAIVKAGHMSKKLVDSLPSTGEDNVLYLVKKIDIDSDSNVFNEYLWINEKFELIGDTNTTVDLSGYIKQSDITICSDQDIANLFL